MGSLFAGIGGFDLGFERAGFETVWQVEIDDYCRRVLERHFTKARRFKDIRDIYRFAHEYPECECCGDEPWCERHGTHFGECACVGCSEWDDEVPFANVITVGFPCQDISVAGKGAGIDEGENSGLWREAVRIIPHLRPDMLLVENVSALLDRGMGRVLGDLASLGYDAEWQVLSAAQFGASHLRERVFIIAYPEGSRIQGVWPQGIEQPSALDRAFLSIRDSNGLWKVEPDVCRIAHGVPCRVDRIEKLGNAVVPQIAQWIAERIKESFSIPNERG